METKVGWLIGGTVLIVAVSALMPFADNITPLIPTPTSPKGSPSETPSASPAPTVTCVA
jgi:hypothetical protein